MELDEQTQEFFKSGGQTEVKEDEAPPVEEPKEEPKPEVQVEKKVPSKFNYSPETDNVVDDLGRKYVPLGAIQEARNENKTLRSKLQDLETKWTGGEAKLNALMAKIQGKEEAPPDYDKNPLENLRSRNEALEAKIKALEEGHGKVTRETEESKQIAEFESSVRSAEGAFAKANPDYGQAVDIVREMWKAEFESAGVPENFIDAMLTRKGQQFSYAAMQKEQNPAEAVYKLAQRYGYKPKKDEPNKDKDKLATIAKGQEAEKSLASGKAPSDMSLEALATMSEEELDAYVADPKNWKKLSKAA